MNKILMMPRGVDARATCKWIATGNSRRPLKCVWTMSVDEAGVATEGRRCR